ncbi:MAG: multicopper oxidase domain-containing protein, partial [Hyphomicrobium sp.]
MYLSKLASRARQREAENARNNRLEIVQALSTGEITRRDLFRWGLFTAAGTLALKNGLSPYAQSAYGAVPTGAPRSPLFGAQKFTQVMPRAGSVPEYHLQSNGAGDYNWIDGAGAERAAKRLSWHNDFNAGNPNAVNPVTNVGPVEGRPPGEFFAHQRWSGSGIEPAYGYVLSVGQVKANARFHPRMPAQNPNSVWSFGARTPGMAGNALGSRTGSPSPLLVKCRYGQPLVCRIYNDLPVNRADNGGFGRNETSTHFHNAHNGAESDGACNAYHFPGTFYDYHWGTTLARRDLPSVWPTTVPGWLDKASGPDDANGIHRVPGDFRELQGSMWFHDHRFFFTAENVHKGMFALCNFYSGPDRAREDLADGINLRLPSGKRLAWGNTDFDVNLAISNPAFKADGQLFFDIFDTDGFLGDVLAVNGVYAPYMEVLPRRYRFRILNASMSRFLKLILAVKSSTSFATGTPVPMYFIANDGNLIVSPIKLLTLDEMGVAERYDVVVDFSQFKPGDRIQMVNLLQQTSGRKPDGAVALATAMNGGVANDPCVGPVLEFRVASTVRSNDDPTYVYSSATHIDESENLGSAPWILKTKTLTTQIPIVAPVRERVMEFGRSGTGDSRDNPDGQCIPECGDIVSFPWTIKVNGQAAHSLNANRISELIPKPGEVEHWTLINGGGGWDHPIHLHYEEGVTIDRGTGIIPATEKFVRKDVWRLRPSGRVKFQVRFGEFGGAYFNH